MAMKKGRCNVVGFTLVFALLIIGSMVGCKQDSDSSVCKCPNGTNHYPNDCTCGADDCNCINEVPESPELRTETIAFIGDWYNGENEDEKWNVCTVEFEGTLLATEWEGLAQRFQTALQASYDAQPHPMIKARYNVFCNLNSHECKVVVEKTSTFDKWSVSNQRLIKFNFDYLKSLSDAELASDAVMRTAVFEMFNAPVPE